MTTMSKVGLEHFWMTALLFSTYVVTYLVGIFFLPRSVHWICTHPHLSAPPKTARGGACKVMVS